MKNILIAASPSSPMRSGPLAVVLLLLVSMAFSTNASWAANDAKDKGAQLLKAQLPDGTGIRQADCELLTRAVTRATVAHRAEAPAILKAALMNESTEDVLRKEDRRACECVSRIVRASVKAAPAHASDMIDVAMAIYPECAEALAIILDQGKGAISQPVAGINNIVSGGDAGADGNAGFTGSPSFGGGSSNGGQPLPTPAGVAVTEAVNR